VLVLLGLILTACGVGGSGVTVGKKIALLVPDSAAARFDSKDRPYFEAKVTQLCTNCQVLYSKAKTEADQQAQAQTAIAGGAAAIVLDPVDPAAAAAIVTMAKAANIPLISYDGLVKNEADVAYYVGFDDAAVGVLQGTDLLTAMGTKAKPTVVELNGDAVDARANLFKEGAHSVLDGKVKFGGEYSTPKWKAADAQAEMQQALVATSRHVDGVVAADDAIAGGAIAAMKAAGIKPLPPVTGEGADLAAIQRIITGDQRTTVYESVKAEAESAAELAYDLAFGVTVPASLTLGKTINNGAGDIPAILVEPVVVTKVNIESTVVADGFWNAADICTSKYISACATAGIS
jgi:D-xylose transport system substrate-binding protein